MMSNYLNTIGIEVHVELKTNTKIFSNSVNGYGESANSLTNLVDLGYPGTLPTLNKEVVRLAIKACKVLNCNIRREMYFDRKNYFYPDNPKNYQITQARTPIGYDGYVEIEVDGKPKKIEIGGFSLHKFEEPCISGENGSGTVFFSKCNMNCVFCQNYEISNLGNRAKNRNRRITHRRRYMQKYS